MASTPTRNINLTTELKAYILCRVATGDSSNAREVVRAGLRLPRKRDRAVPRARTAAARVSSAR